MKKLITTPVVFDASSKTLDFGAIEDFNIRYLYGVINQTKGQMIYSVASSTLGFTSFAGSVITLQFDTTTHSDDDVLLVLYENSDDYATLFSLYTQFVNSLGWMGNARNTDDSLRATIIGTVPVSGSLTTITTVSTVTNLAQIGGVAANNMLSDLQNLLFQAQQQNFLKFT